MRQLLLLTLLLPVVAQAQTLSQTRSRIAELEASRQHLADSLNRLDRALDELREMEQRMTLDSAIASGTAIVFTKGTAKLRDKPAGIGTARFIGNLTPADTLVVLDVERDFYRVSVRGQVGYVMTGSIAGVERPDRNETRTRSTPSTPPARTAPSRTQAAPAPSRTQAAPAPSRSRGTRSTPNCRTGKPCGDTCIARNKTCHK